MGALAWGEIRRRWRAAAVIGVVLGVGFAAVLAAAVGAHRTDTAFPRMLAATSAPELLVSSATADQTLRRRFYGQVATLEGVARTGLAAGVELVPTSVPKGKGTVIEACSHLSVDGIFGYEIARPNVVEGRLPNLDRSDEILVSHSYAETFGVGVGDELDLVVAPSPGAVPPAGEATAADGAVAHVTIVGVGVLSTEVVPLSDLDRAPRVFASPALVSRYAPEQESQCYDAAVLDLTPGADPGRVSAEIERISGPAGEALIQDLTRNYADVRRAVQPRVSALWLFAAAAAAGTLLVVAQLLSRQLEESTMTAAPVWRALGATKLTTQTLVAVPGAVTAAVGTVVALAGALWLSGRFPIGPARLAEPNPGPEFHAGMHLGGALVVIALPVVIGAATALLVTRSRAQPPSVGGFARMRGAPANPAVVVGIHLAVDSRRGGGGVPVRSAMAGVSVAIAAAVATITFAGALHDLVSEPARYGRNWDVMIDGEFAPTPVANVLEDLGDHPAVAAIAGGRYGDIVIDDARVPAVGLTDLVGRTLPTIIEGRAPSREDEIVLGKRTLNDLGRSIGDTVAVDAGTGTRNMNIVGVATFPRINRGSFSTLGLGVGAMVSPPAFPPYDLEGFVNLSPGVQRDAFIGPDGMTYEFVTIRTRPGSTPESRQEILTTAVALAGAHQQRVRTEQRPIAIDNYAAVESTPVVLAALLGAMAAATLGHLMVITVRRRRRDLAVCAALGMQRSQLSAAVVIQAVLVVGLATLVGVPVGLAGGRLAWASFSSDLGVIDALRLPLFAVGVTVLVVVGLGLAVSLMPAIAARRTRPALLLRSE